MKVLSLSLIATLGLVVACTTVRPTRAIMPSLDPGSSSSVSSAISPSLAQSASATLAGTSAAKPLGGSYDEGVSMFRQARPEQEAAKANSELYLEICEETCALPGLFSEQITIARATGKSARVAGIGAPLPIEAISYLAAANDFGSRYNRALYDRFHSALPAPGPGPGAGAGAGAK